MNLSIKLTKEDSAHEEAVSIFDSGRWSSPAGGWLTPETGRWNQLPAGLYLEPDGSVGRVAELRGLVRTQVAVGHTGAVYYNRLGSTGIWRIIAD